MIISDIVGRILTRIDDNPAAPVSVYVAPTDPVVNGVTIASEVLAAVNEGQQLAALLTLCLENTVEYQLGGDTWITPRQGLADLIVPLRIVVAGARLRPSTLMELDAWNSSWQATAGTPARYASLGCNLLAITPQASVLAQLTYAQSPAMMGPMDTPVIPVEHHEDLVEYGIYRVKLREGAQQLTRGLNNLNAFLDSMTRLGNQTRAKSLLAGNFPLPFELDKFDRSKLIDEVAKFHGGAKPTREA